MGRNKYVPQPWESDKGEKDTSANLFHSMLYSDAFLDLGEGAKMLYLYMKDRQFSVPEKAHPLFAPGHPRPDTFTFHKKLYRNYHLFSDKTFTKLRDELLLHGFIEVAKDGNGFLCDGANTREETIYRFSDKWRAWNTAAYKLDVDKLPVSTKNKLKEKKIDSRGHETKRKNNFAKKKKTQTDSMPDHLSERDD